MVPFDDPLPTETAVKHRRRILVEVLIYHQRTENTGCACGWLRLGASWAEHIVDVYEMELEQYQ